MPVNRRQFIDVSLKGVLGGSLSAASLTPWHSVAKSRRAMGEIHIDVAQSAKELATSSPLIIMLPAGCESNVRPVASLFKQLSGVQVDTLSVPVDDINTKMFLAAKSQQHTYDIALPATFGIPDLAEAGAIADLSEYRQKYEPKDLARASLYSLGDSYRGNFYGYQTDGDTYLMFYNQLLLDDDARKRFEDSFGKAYALPETWDELDKHMAFFHRPEKQEYGGALFRTPDYVLWEWWIRFHANGGLPLDDDLTPRINSDAGIAALEALTSASRYLYPEARANGLVANWQAYQKGNIYANIGWGGTQKYLSRPESQVKGHMRHTSTPGARHGEKVVPCPYFNWGWNYTVAANAKSPELAYLFSLFAACPVPSTLAVRAKDGFFDPFREEHYSDPQIIDTYGKEFLTAHQGSMRQCFPDFYLSGQTRYFSVLRKYIVMAESGTISAKKALDVVAKAWHKLHLRQGLEKQREQWRLLKSRYPETLLKLAEKTK